MSKSIAAAVVAASITIGGLGGVVLGTPVLSGAQETAEGAVGWVQQALSGLVSDGTITQDQANAVAGALHEAKPDRPHRHHRHGLRLSFQAAAEALGMSPEELREALDGQTSIADIAAQRNVDVQTVVDAIVAAHKEKLDEKVAEGELSQVEADERLAQVTERATEFVNRDLPEPRPGARPNGRRGPGGAGFGPDGRPSDAPSESGEPTQTVA